ncbi:GIY-YIG nuclease family protein [Streptomyces mirabilis]
MEDLVYVIGVPESHVAKVGVSNAPERRLRQIQSMSPLPLQVLWTCSGGYDLERRLHLYLAPYRSHGEWFNFQGLDPVATVRAAVAAVGQQAETAQAGLPPLSLLQPDCVCGHEYARHGKEGCTLYNGGEEWHKCQCGTYVSVRIRESVPSLTRVPEPRVPQGGWQGPEPQNHSKLIADLRYPAVHEEITRFAWPGGAPMVPGWWPEHLAKCVIWRLWQAPEIDRHPSVILDEIVRMHWGVSNEDSPMVPGAFAEQLTDRIVHCLRCSGL